jgi:hypothetical protein
MPYSHENGTLWRDHQCVFDKEKTEEAVKRFWDVEATAVHEMLRRLLAEPATYAEHTRHMACQTIMAIAHGMDVLPKGDPYICIGEVATCAPAATLRWAGVYWCRLLCRL